MMYLAVILGGIAFLLERLWSAKDRNDFLFIVFLEKNWLTTVINISFGMLLVFMFNVEINHIIISNYDITIIICVMVGTMGMWTFKLLRKIITFLFSSIYKFLKSKISNKFKVN